MNAIYKHPVDGFTFLENVPEKPKYIDCLTEESFSFVSDHAAYERALAECIEKRLVIGNPEICSLDNGRYFTDGKHSYLAKEGELYPWPGTLGKKYQFKQSSGSEWIDCSVSVWNNYKELKGQAWPQSREVVVLSPPKEEKVRVGNDGFAFNEQSTIRPSDIGEPVNSSMSEKEEKYVNPCFVNGLHTNVPRVKSEPVVSQDQEPEAVKFANWISLNNWEAVQSGGMWYQYIDPHTYLKKTTSELYELFSRKPID